jgi:hypothetical protein
MEVSSIFHWAIWKFSEFMTGAVAKPEDKQP